LLSERNLTFLLGYVAAIKAGQRGLKTVCIEKRGTLGGTCLNVGCIPSKALLNATHKLHEAQHKFKDMGIITGPVSIDFKQLMNTKEKAVTGLTGGIEFLFKKNKVDYVKGWGKFAGPNAIDVDLIGGGSSQIKAKNIIIATGSEPNELEVCRQLNWCSFSRENTEENGRSGWWCDRARDGQRLSAPWYRGYCYSAHGQNLPILRCRNW
jgi:pyruvate/2-oxoglutarate dehydrogenase complex dihydrolipoamide dehydrogenase (E3) component